MKTERADSKKKKEPYDLPMLINHIWHSGNNVGESVMCIGKW